MHATVQVRGVEDRERDRRRRRGCGGPRREAAENDGARSDGREREIRAIHDGSLAEIQCRRVKASDTRPLREGPRRAPRETLRGEEEARGRSCSGSRRPTRTPTPRSTSAARWSSSSRRSSRRSARTSASTGHAGALPKVPRPRRTTRARSRASSSATSARPASSTRRRGACGAPAPRSRPSTAARCRTRWRRCSRCPASDARPPTSSSATPSARTRASSSTPTSAASPGAWGSRRQTDPVKVENDLNALVPKGKRTMAAHRLIFHGRRVCQARKPLRECPVLPLCPRVGVA